LAKILIADDEQNIRTFLRTALQSEGHTVIEAKDGAEALELITREGPELLILDVQMPRLTGFDVLRRLQAQGQEDKRVLFLTGATDEEDFLKGWGYGADGYLTKPMDIDVLLKAVDEVMALSTKERQERRDREIERARLLRQLDRFLD